jgi:hypothetical protein
MNQDHLWIKGTAKPDEKADPIIVTIQAHTRVFEGFVDLMAGWLSLAGMEFEFHALKPTEKNSDHPSVGILVTQAVGVSAEEFFNESEN